MGDGSRFRDRVGQVEGPACSRELQPQDCSTEDRREATARGRSEEAEGIQAVRAPQPPDHGTGPRRQGLVALLRTVWWDDISAEQGQEGMRGGTGTSGVPTLVGHPASSAVPGPTPSAGNDRHLRDQEGVREAREADRSECHRADPQILRIRAHSLVCSFLHLLTSHSSVASPVLGSQWGLRRPNEGHTRQ